MPSAVNQDAFPNRGWGGQGPGPRGVWGNPRPYQPEPSWDAPQGYAPQWAGPPFWHPAGMSRPVAIAFTVLGFIFWWPVGLAILFYMMGTGRMGCFGRRNRRAMYQARNGQGTAPFDDWKAWAFGGNRSASSSGNHAFDEYKSETLRRLEEEQQEFASFLERLRFAKDKAEFDQFMAERRNRPPASPTEDHPAA